MKVIRHQTISHHRQALLPHRTAQQVQVNLPLRLGSEHELPPISTLGYMLSYVRTDHSR
jgi:hypothetical protein